MKANGLYHQPARDILDSNFATLDSDVKRMLSRLRRLAWTFSTALNAAIARLDKSLDPMQSILRLRGHKWFIGDTVYLFHIANATFWLILMQSPRLPYKLAIPLLYAIALLVPLTSQFFLPATPVFSWLLTFYSNRFTPAAWRPSISVSLLPTLESVLYGANISDILTRFTHPVLDIIAWLPYGVIHFVFPFVVAAFLFLFRSPQALHLWARTFGYMNLIGVLIQLILPCSPPWYELIHGLTPANYAMQGSPGGLARIDALFHSQAYTIGFTNSPLVFGAFPSLHSGNATLEALFLSHFFPQCTRYIWAYASVLYWATMYLTHHYLIDVVGGACLATAFFYFFLPDEMKGAGAFSSSPNLVVRRDKYEFYDLEVPREPASSGLLISARDIDAGSEPSSDDEEMEIPYRSPLPTSSSFPRDTPNGQAASQPQRTSSHTKLSNGGESSRGRGHRHTASIASLIRGEERGPEDGWSPVAATFGFSNTTSARARTD